MYYMDEPANETRDRNSLLCFAWKRRPETVNQLICCRPSRPRPHILYNERSPPRCHLLVSAKRLQSQLPARLQPVLTYVGSHMLEPSIRTVAKGWSCSGFSRAHYYRMDSSAVRTVARSVSAGWRTNRCSVFSHGLAVMFLRQPSGWHKGKSTPKKNTTAPRPIPRQWVVQVVVVVVVFMFVLLPSVDEKVDCLSLQWGKE